jgi:hypothetical protein
MHANTAVPTWVDTFSCIAPAINAACLLDAAMAYAEMGLAVLPLKPGGKTPNCRNGLLDATTDLDRVERWWTSNPSDNIGMRTGLAVDALDVDVKDGAPGWTSARQLNDRRLLAGGFAQASTPSGGGHLLFAVNGGGNHASGKAGHGLDYRGVNGYIVVSPSVIPGVGRYQWTSVSPDRYGPVLDWDALTTALAAPVTARATATPRAGAAGQGGAGLIRTVAQATPGHRNSVLAWAGFRCVENGLDRLLLLDAALSTGMTEREVRSTLRSVAKEAR